MLVVCIATHTIPAGSEPTATPGGGLSSFGMSRREMMMLEAQPGLPDQIALEKNILAFWRDRDIFTHLRSRNRGNPRFSFLDGPITANNRMGLHHARGRAYKDIVQRYFAMQGCEQRYQNGFDCQGLWIEVEVERELGFASKRDIERYGIAEFVEQCKERVRRFADLITQESVRLGCWMDWPNSYFTFSSENNYAIWRFLKKCHERGLVYPGTDVMPWCPRCATGLSQQEMQEGYRDVTHLGVVVRLPIVERDSEYLLVWTTTPWTLTANVAAAVNPDITYAKVCQGDAVYYVAAPRAQEVLTQAQPWRVETTLPGADLVGLRYLGAFDDLPLAEAVASAHRVLAWRDVSAEEGTGIVHLAPGCGKEDYDLVRQQARDLAILVPIDEHGAMLPDTGPFVGKRASEIASEVSDALRDRGLLYRVDDCTHRYPHCWRCGAEILFRLVDEWFIAMDPWREDILRLAEQTDWIPEYGREVERDWLRNMQDWMISKKRYWGLALPIWRCDCGWFDVIGGRDELAHRAVAGWDTFDGHSPHRPWIDEVKIGCEECSGLASRIPDVGNPWLDAGIVPYSTMGYFEDREEWMRWFPADLVIECLPGQFRNWFYSLLAMSTMLEGRAPAKTIVGYGLVLDERGEEMHKSKGNAVWFSEAAEGIGADVIRWVCAAAPLAQPLRFGPAAPEEVRGWLRTLWNCYSFLATYANVDGWPPRGAPPPNAEAPFGEPLDIWLHHRLATGAGTIASAFESFHFTQATTTLVRLLDDLSNWWIRRSRRRFWKSDSDADKEDAYRALWTALATVARLVAPIMPFTAEALYRRLRVPFADALPESVHLCDFPDFAARGNGVKVAALVDECDRARLICRLGRAARASAGLRVRQPLAAAFVLGEGNALPRFEEHVLEELNVKCLDFVSDRSALGDTVAEEAGVAVGLDTTLTSDLRLEGLARDLIRHVQTLRKRANLAIDRRIRLHVQCDEGGEVYRAVDTHRTSIASETLADQITEGPPPADAPTSAVRVGGARAIVAVVPVKSPSGQQ
jgi:isoleucyl-tRNA synthetase